MSVYLIVMISTVPTVKFHFDAVYLPLTFLFACVQKNTRDHVFTLIPWLKPYKMWTFTIKANFYLHFNINDHGLFETIKAS